MRNIVIDIGNTRIKTGLFEGAGLQQLKLWPTEDVEKMLYWTTNQKAENVILSTVAGHPASSIENRLRRQFFYICLDPATPVPINNRYRTPQTLGQDRLAAVVGAFQLYPYENCLVIDAGTCITYDLIDRKGNFLGGNIAPGINLRLKAMHAFTAGLPQVPAGETESWIGNTTSSAMRNGAQLGAVLEMEGFIGNCRRQMGEVNVILTGGDADFFAKKLKSEIFVNHHLVLLGLNKILTYNVKRLE